MTDVIGVLAQMRSGAVMADLNTKFNDVLDAVLNTGKKGSVTIKLSVSPSKRAFGGAVAEVEVDHDVKTAKPEMELGKSFFFVTNKGDLTRDDPDTTGLLEGVEAIREEREEREANAG